MTEKRFSAKLTHYGSSRNHVEAIKDNQSNTELISIIEIIDVLNEQHKENQKLNENIEWINEFLNSLIQEYESKIKIYSEKNDEFSKNLYEIKYYTTCDIRDYINGKLFRDKIKEWRKRE